MGTLRSRAAGSTTINDGVWHHVVGVRKGDSFTLYVDGEADGSATLESIALNTMTIGALKRSIVGNPVHPGSSDCSRRSSPVEALPEGAYC